jgi:tryptophan 2,3-dioxygenase
MCVIGEFSLGNKNALMMEPHRHRPDLLGPLERLHREPSLYDEAVRLLEKAVELKPADPVINDHLGDAYWRSGRQADARFEWLAALRLKPEAAREITLREKLEKGLPAMPGARLASRP